jgi:iron complex outermembrane receptor protein
MALGVEHIRYGLRQDVHRPGGTGPSSTASQTVDTHITRDVTGIFAEFLIPVADTVDLNVAARRDDYSDFGTTTNPKVAINWTPSDSLRIRGAWGTSYTAPALTSRGEIDSGFTTESGWGADGNNEFIGPDSTLANVTEFLATAPGCDPTGCQTGDVDGIRVTGGNKDLKAAEGETWSVGFDIRQPDWAPGLELHVTYWDSLYEGMITAPTQRNVINVPGLNDRIILLPTQAQIDNWIRGLPQSSQVPDDVWYIYSFQQVNAFNIDAAGIDYDVKYRFSGDKTQWTVGLAASTKVRFDQQSGEGDIWQDFLDVDANTTFSSFDFLGVATVELDRGGLNAKLQMNHTGGHKKLNDPLQSKVDSYTTFDLYTSYNFQGSGLLRDMNVYLQINDITDEEPPFYNVRQGFNTSEVNPIGRVITAGFRKSW